ncbi:MAG: hypothetical protein E7591_03000 [Ruminococcaceae bacterium]|nr:hypothetical protein [Oscillospiraceae bacterium]
MRPEKLHDALNYLDDDLIISADKRRRNRDEDKRIWFRIIPAAACFCLILTGVLVARHTGMLDSKDSVVQEETQIETSLHSEDNGSFDGEASQSSPLPGVDDNSSSGLKNESTDDFSNESISESEERPSFIVTIEKWDKNGFDGIISEIADTKLFPEGTKVKVVFSDRCRILTPIENGYSDRAGTPCPEEFPAGTKVCIQFYSYEEKDEYVILYSDQIIKSKEE